MAKKQSKMDEAMIAKGWWPVAQAADKVGKHVSTLYRLVRSGELEATEVGGRVFVSSASCVKWLGEDGAKALGLLTE